MAIAAREEAGLAGGRTRYPFWPRGSVNSFLRKVAIERIAATASRRSRADRPVVAGLLVPNMIIRADWACGCTDDAEASGKIDLTACRPL